MNRRAFIRTGLLWLPSAAVAQGYLPHRRKAFQPVVAAGGETYLLQEDLTDASVGWDNNNANGWVPDDANTNPKYATAPAPLVGSYSVSTKLGSKARADFTATGEVWIYFVFAVPALPSNENVCLYLYSGATHLATLAVAGDYTCRMRFKVGSTWADRTVSSIATGTVYQFWLHYKKGTGSDASGDFEFQPVGSARAGSGNTYTSVSGADSTANASRIYVIENTGADLFIYDTIRVSGTGYYVP